MDKKLRLRYCVVSLARLCSLLEWRWKVVHHSLSSELIKQVEEHDQKLEEEVTVMLTDCEKQLNGGFQLVAKFTLHMSDW